MRVVPRNLAPQIQWFEAHVRPWTEHADQIGVSPDDVAALRDKAAAARAALREQQQLRSAARAATTRLKLAVADMANAGADLILQIRVHASQSGSDGVYALAAVPVPAKPSPIGPPGTPHTFAAELTAIGTLVLRWKCKHPRGAVNTQYHVRRQIGPAGAFEFLGYSGERRFEDVTVPAGTASVTYQIQAKRSTSAGRYAQFQVNFGTTGRRIGGVRVAHLKQFPARAA